MNKNLLILAGVLVVGAAAALLIEPGGKRKRGEALPESLLSGADIVRIDEIAINELQMKRDDRNRWIGAEFIADGKKVGDFFDRVADADIVDRMPLTKDDTKEYGFAGAKTVTFNANGESIVSLEIGDDSASGGQYVRLNGSDRVLLIGKKLAANTEVSSWERKELLAIEKDLISEISFFLAAKTPRFVVNREKKEDDLQLRNPAKGRTAAPGIKNFVNLFANISFEEKFDPSNEEASTALSQGAHRVEFATFDGRRYRLDIGELGKDDKKKVFLRIAIVAKGEGLDEASQLELDTLQETANKWVFKISNYHGGRFRKAASDFYEADKKS